MRPGLFALLAISLLFLVGCTGQGRFSIKGGWSGPAVFGDTVYVGSQDGRIRALDALTGASVWRNSFPAEDKDALGPVLYGTPAVDEERVYFGTYNGRVFALDAATGEPAWTWPSQASVNGQTIGINGHIIGGPTLAGREQCINTTGALVPGDVLLVGSTEGIVYALCAGDGSLAWRFPGLAQTGALAGVGEVWASPTVDGDTVYVGSLDHRLYAVNLDRGNQQWSFKAGGAIVAQPVVADGKVFFGALDGNFYAVDARGGAPAWVEPFKGDNWFWAGAVTDGERVYAVDTGGTIYGLDVDTGFLHWEGDAGGMVISAPVLVEFGGEQRLVVVSKDGRISVRKISVLTLDSNQEDWVPEITGPEGDSLKVKVKAPLGRMSPELIEAMREESQEAPELQTRLRRWESTVFVNTMDPWSVQVLSLENSKVRQLAASR